MPDEQPQQPIVQEDVAYNQQEIDIIKAQMTKLSQTIQSVEDTYEKRAGQTKEEYEQALKRAYDQIRREQAEGKQLML